MLFPSSTTLSKIDQITWCNKSCPHQWVPERCWHWQLWMLSLKIISRLGSPISYWCHKIRGLASDPLVKWFMSSLPMTINSKIFIFTVPLEGFHTLGVPLVIEMLFWHFPVCHSSSLNWYLSYPKFSPTKVIHLHSFIYTYLSAHGSFSISFASLHIDYFIWSLDIL